MLYFKHLDRHRLRIGALKKFWSHPRDHPRIPHPALHPDITGIQSGSNQEFSMAQTYYFGYTFKDGRHLYVISHHRVKDIWTQIW